MGPAGSHRLLQAGVFLVALSGLTLEIGLTRIFSATIWYHFAFVAVSVALLGWGLGGLALHLWRRGEKGTLGAAAVFCLLQAVAIPLSLWLIVRVPFHPRRLPFYFGAALLPFLLAGTSLAAVFALRQALIGQLYFADLLGASTGAAAVTFLLSNLGAETTVLVAALFPLAAAACFSRRLAPVAAGGAVVLLTAVVWHRQEDAFGIRNAPTKGMYRHLAAQPGARVELTGWNAYSRVDAVTGFPGTLARLYIDADAWTNLHPWDGDRRSLVHMREWFRALPFRLAPAGGEALIIGPGGGSDVLVALATGASRVTAVELNPLVLRFVRHFGERAGRLYDHPLVEARLGEGRTFLGRTRRAFDVIFLGFVDSWASVASGGLSLSENYLYTVEAFDAYRRRLTPDGLLVILRWGDDVPRLVANAVALMGPEAAASRVAVVMERRGSGDDPPQMIFMMRRRPFTAAESDAILSWPKARPVIVPGRMADAPYADLFAGRKTVEQYEEESPRRVDPVTDDRPFYFARFKPLGLPLGMLGAFAQVLGPALVLCAALAVAGHRRSRDPQAFIGSLAYFACLGVGFIAVELALLQSLTLLLGHPVFTLSVLLFVLLAAGGLGSRSSGRFHPPAVCLTVAGLAVAYGLVLPHLVPALLPLPLWARIAISLAVLAPLGFAMGMPFPQGLQRVGQGPLPAPPFYWGLNGVFSVVGSLLTVLIAVNLGFRAAIVAGALCYLGAAAAWGRLAGGLNRRPAPAPEAEGPAGTRAAARAAPAARIRG